MASAAYKGSVTTTGTSEAIRFDKALFRQNPEFSQKAKVEAHIVAPGTLIVNVVDETPQDQFERDPMVAAFLSFIESDARKNPQNIIGFSEKEMADSRELTKTVVVSDDDVIPDDVTF